MKRILLRGAIALLALAAALAAVLAYNTSRLASRQLLPGAAAPPAIDTAAAAGRLAGALRIRTLPGPEAAASGVFQQFHQYLERTYPRAHAALKREVVNRHSLLYTWPGTDPALPPMLLMAHQDVVPAEGAGWRVDPFAGEVRDGFIWGRGAWDNKSAITAHMEAVELLLARGFQPRQTIHFAYGHDEESHGHEGARRIAELLRSRGVRLDFVLDEGMIVSEGILKAVPAPAALVGVAEKGYLSIVLRVAGQSGHSLMPPAPGTGPIAVLGDALRRLEAAPLPGAVEGLAREMLETLAPEMTGPNRVVLSNLWLFAPLVEHQFSQKPVTSAMLRTTTALTMLSAGVKENVLPLAAEATVNFRLRPGDRREDVLAHVRRAVDDARVQITELPGGSDPSPVSSTRSESWRRMGLSIREAFPDAVVAPGLVLGGTDARHFTALSDHIYRFSPVRVRNEDADRIHGANERLSVANYGEMIRFYLALMRGTAPVPGH